MFGTHLRGLDKCFDRQAWDDVTQVILLCASTLKDGGQMARQHGANKVRTQVDNSLPSHEPR